MRHGAGGGISLLKEADEEDCIAPCTSGTETTQKGVRLDPGL